MYSQFEDRLRDLLESATEIERKGIENVLHLFAENIQSNDDIESIKKYLQNRLNKKRSLGKKGDLSFLEVRNQLSHKGHVAESRVNILIYEGLIWEILPRIRSFDHPDALRNLLAYVMNRSVGGDLKFIDKETIVKEYRQLYKHLPRREKERILFDLTRRIFAEVSRPELEELIEVTRGKKLTNYRRP